MKRRILGLILIIGFIISLSSNSSKIYSEISESEYSYSFKKLGFIKYPLMTNPSILLKGQYLNISTSLNNSINHIVTLVNEDYKHNLDCSDKLNVKNESEIMCLIHSSINFGLYTLKVNVTSNSLELNDFAWNSVQILEKYPDTVKIIHISDNHVGTPNLESQPYLKLAIAYINQIKPNFVLHSGDFLYGGDYRKNFSQTIERARLGMEVLSELEVPIYMINGNHDIYSDVTYWNRYINPTYQFSFDFSFLHVTLTSIKNHLTALPQTNLSWIKSDILNNSDKETLFVYHSDFADQYTDYSGTNLIGAEYHIIGHEHRSKVEKFSNYQKIYTGNLYYMNDDEPGEYRLLTFENDSLVNNEVYQLFDTTPYPSTSLESATSSSMSSSPSSIPSSSSFSTFSSMDVKTKSSSTATTTSNFKGIFVILLTLVVVFLFRKKRE